MSDDRTPPVIVAAEAPARTKKSNYPSPFAERMEGREKRRLGDLFGLQNFGVNLTRLAPGAISALRHAHTKQDELVYILEGTATLMDDDGAHEMGPGTCAGFRAGTGRAHQIVNRSDADVVYLEIGDRSPGDGASYPDDDLVARLVDGAWVFTHRDGTPY